MTEPNYDVIIIGAGPGGYVSAIRASQLGMRVAVIESDHLGGICLNWGCIPTKALLRTSEIFHNSKHAQDYGINIKGLSFDINKVVERSRGVAKQLSSGVKHLLKQNKVTVISGHGFITGKGEVTVKNGDKNIGVFKSKNIILASGARPKILPGIEPDGNLVWTYKDAMTPNIFPKSLLVVGSGAIGIEFASFYNTLGSDVTIVEVMDRILPIEDSEISDFAKKSFLKQGMKILTNANIKDLNKSSNHVTVTIAHNGKNEKKTFDRVISAVGIVGNVENIGIEKTKIKVKKSHVLTNKWMETDEPNIYSIGDLTGPPWLAHKASHEGIICVEKIAGVNDVHPLQVQKIPGCTYSLPQIASVGLTEESAKNNGYKIRVGRFPFMGNGKAIALGEPEGLVKTIFDFNTGELLGAHMIGAEVTELIQGFVVAMNLETTEIELMQSIFPHPTLSEMMHESVLSAYDKTIHF